MPRNIANLWVRYYRVFIREKYELKESSLWQRGVCMKSYGKRYGWHSSTYEFLLITPSEVICCSSSKNHSFFLFSKMAPKFRIFLRNTVLLRCSLTIAGKTVLWRHLDLAALLSDHLLRNPTFSARTVLRQLAVKVSTTTVPLHLNEWKLVILDW